MARTTFSSTLNGDVFIIPNSSACFNRETLKGYNLDFWSDINEQYNLLKWREKKEEFSNSEFETEEFVELWFANEDIDNWFDHGVYDESETQWRPLTKNLPKTLFYGKKEGDKVSFSMIFTSRINDMEVRKRVPVTLTLSQLKYRYKRFGTFEECLKTV